MLKKEKRNKITKKSQLIIVGSLLLLLGIGIITNKIIVIINQNEIEKESLDNFYKEQEIIEEIISNEPIEEATEKIEEITEKKEVNKITYQYIAVLKIPKINLERGLVSKDCIYNNVEKNIQILKESDMPDIVNGNLILAAHSGSGKNAYFRDVYKLSINDIVGVVYNGFEYKYKVVNIYDIEKTGTAHIIRNQNKTTLTLITCRNNTEKQIIVICELIEGGYNE